MYQIALSKYCWKRYNTQTHSKKRPATVWNIYFGPIEQTVCPNLYKFAVVWYKINMHIQDILWVEKIITHAVFSTTKNGGALVKSGGVLIGGILVVRAFWPVAVATHWQILSHNDNVVHIALIKIRTHNISGDRYKSNYHRITPHGHDGPPSCHGIDHVAMPMEYKGTWSNRPTAKSPPSISPHLSKSPQHLKK